VIVQQGQSIVVTVHAPAIIKSAAWWFSCTVSSFI